MRFNIKDENKHSSGIYNIKNEFGEIIYIGKALDFNKRYHAHNIEIDRLNKNDIFNFISEMSNKDSWSFNALEIMDGALEDDIYSREKELILEFGSICNYENQFDFSILKELLSYKYKYIELKSKYDEINCVKENDNEKVKLSSVNNSKFIFVKTMHLQQEYLDLKKYDKLKYLIMGCNTTTSGKISYGNNVSVKSKSDISKLLGKSDDGKTIRKFFKLELLGEVNKRYYMNGDICKRGKITDKKGVYTKLYIDSIVDLYHTKGECFDKSRSVLSNLTELLPYINRKYNILCNNPFEKDIEEIDPLDFNSIRRICGYQEKATSQSISGFRRSLLSLKLKNGRPLFVKIKNDVLNKTGYSYVVNPDVVFASNSYEDYMYIINNYIKPHECDDDVRPYK